jgi:Lrp/AsnC family leucine-responsive transcriptional regulator
MKKPNPDMPRLTRNDKEVLKSIIQHAKIPDSEIAKKMKLSPQAVYKIRKKLEESGIIRGYMPIIDFKKLGINVMVILVVRLTGEVWEKFSDDEISEKMKKVPYIIEAYRLPESDATHILLMGFRNIQQKDRYLIKMQTEFAKEIEIKQVFPFSIDRVITQSPVGLLYEILDKKEFPINVFFLPRKKKKL